MAMYMSSNGLHLDYCIPTKSVEGLYIHTLLLRSTLIVCSGVASPHRLEELQRFVRDLGTEDPQRGPGAFSLNYMIILIMKKCKFEVSYTTVS